MSTLKLAWRNTWRNRRRTMVTVAAMTIALVVTILYSAMVDGYLVHMESGALDFEVGAVQIHPQGYRKKPSLHTRIDDVEAVLARLEEAGLPASQRLLAGGLVASREFSAGAVLRGVDVARESRVLALSEQLLAGSWLDDADPKGVVIGRRLARTLDVQPGGEMILVSQAADGSTANELFHVRGVLKGLGDATDRAGVFVPIATFREVFSLPEGAHQILIKRLSAMPLAEEQARAIAAAPGHEVKTWRELLPTMASVLDSTRGMIGFMFFIVNVAIAIVILNAMLMSVFERIKEFGVLKALGIAPSQVLLMIYLEALLQVGIAIGLGLAIAAPSLWYLASVGIDTSGLSGVTAMGMAMMSQWTAVVSVRSFSGPVTMMVVIVSLAVLYPAVKAAWIRPVEAMRHQ